MKLHHVMSAALLVATATAVAQPASAPSPAASAASAPAALTRADVRPTACGEPGIGEVYGGPRAGTIERRDGVPGYRVTEDGHWAVGCAMPTPPKPPRDCGPAAPAVWTQDGNTCAPQTRRPALQHGRHALHLRQIGPARGSMIEQCVDGKRQTVSADCRPATHCATLYTITRVDGVYRFDGRRTPVPLGATVDATTADGRTWPATCTQAGYWSAPSSRQGWRAK